MSLLYSNWTLQLNITYRENSTYQVLLLGLRNRVEEWSTSAQTVLVRSLSCLLGQFLLELLSSLACAASLESLKRS